MADLKKLTRPARVAGFKQKLGEDILSPGIPAGNADEKFLRELLASDNINSIVDFLKFVLPKLPTDTRLPPASPFHSFINYYSTDTSSPALFKSKNVDDLVAEVSNDIELAKKVLAKAIFWLTAEEARQLIKAYRQNESAEPAETDKPGDGEVQDDQGDELPAEDQGTGDQAGEPAGEEPPTAEEPKAEEEPGDEPGEEDNGEEDAELADLADQELPAEDDPEAGPEDGEGDGEPPADEQPAEEEPGEEKPEEDGAEEPVEVFNGETVAKFVAKHVGIENPDDIVDTIQSLLG